MTQFTTGTRVRVTAAGGGLFYSGNKGKTGLVTRTSRAGEIIHVRFDDGVEDYGRTSDVEVVGGDKIVVGSKVKVIRSVVFLGKFEGKTGNVTRVDGRTIFVRFDEGGTDYGLIDELELVNAKDKDGFISNAGNTTGKLPVPRGTKLDVLYNDGTLILDIAIGDGTSKRASNNSNSYSATTWTYSDRGQATIKAYRFPADRPSASLSLDEQLAALRAEVDAANTEKREAQAALTAARKVYDAAEAKRVAVEARLTKHGLRLI